MKTMLVPTCLLMLFAGEVIAQVPSGTHDEEYYLYNNADYPNNQSPFWGTGGLFDDHALSNGIAHDDANWYITAQGANVFTGADNHTWALWKIPVTEDLAEDDFSDPPHLKLSYGEVPISYNGFIGYYEHAGDLDCFEHNNVFYLAIPLYGGSTYDNPLLPPVDALPAAIGFFRANDLTFIDYEILDPVHGNTGWCAVHPVTKELYTSGHHPNTFYSYTIDWGRLFDNDRHDALTGVSPHPIVTGYPGNKLHHMQGGEFTPTGSLLYVNCGIINCDIPFVHDGDPQNPGDGINVFETAGSSFELLHHSTNQEAAIIHGVVLLDSIIIRPAELSCFDYTFDNNSCEGQEPEGLTVWDMDAVPGHHSSISGQLHVILYNHEFGSNNKVSLKHYSTVKVDAGPDITAECMSSTLTPVELSCTVGNSALCDSALTFLWSAPDIVFDSPTSQTTIGYFPEGPALPPTVVTITVKDGPSRSTDTVLVRIVDTTPPVIVTILDHIALWPPNHAYHTITTEDCIESVTDVCDDAPLVTVIQVTSDESEDASGGGDGHTLNDAVLDCPNTVELRAERLGSSNGRVYGITYAATDNWGNQSIALCRIFVPHDNSGSSAIVGPGSGYSVDSCGISHRMAHEASQSTVIELWQSSPNPFNHSTTIQFTLAEDEFVLLNVVDLVGREVATLNAQELTAGTHTLTWVADALPSGTYYCRLRAGSFTDTKQLVLLK
jgi:hypothetical protein